MFGGLGSRNPQMRFIRLGLLAAVLLAGYAFHDSGPTYTAIRVVYFAVLIGFVGFALYRRSVHKHQDPSSPGTPPPGAPPAAPPAAPSGAPPAAPPSPTVPGAPGSATSPVLNPGWYPDQHDMKVQRYWDGSAWVGTRHWEENRWVDG